MQEALRSEQPTIRSANLFRSLGAAWTSRRLLRIVQHAAGGRPAARPVDPGHRTARRYGSEATRMTAAPSELRSVE